MQNSGQGFRTQMRRLATSIVSCVNNFNDVLGTVACNDSVTPCYFLI